MRLPALQAGYIQCGGTLSLWERAARSEDAK